MPKQQPEAVIKFSASTWKGNWATGSISTVHQATELNYTKAGSRQQLGHCHTNELFVLTPLLRLTGMSWSGIPQGNLNIRLYEKCVILWPAMIHNENRNEISMTEWSSIYINQGLQAMLRFDKWAPALPIIYPWDSKYASKWISIYTHLRVQLSTYY